MQRDHQRAARSTWPSSAHSADPPIRPIRTGSRSPTSRRRSCEVFHPAIEVVKTADPTTLLGGGDVTYTYQVRNTGDVPLAGVADRITDDTCSPVTYVSGDEDGDGLLDTPTSIFEDALDETWIFTCTTTVDEDTTNVVTVTGTPTDPERGAALPVTRAGTGAG